MSFIDSFPPLEKYVVSGRILKSALAAALEAAVKGATTKDIDLAAYNTILDFGGRPAFLGYMGFPASCCICINEEVVHCIPSHRKLIDNDIISIDCGVVYDGVYTDACRSIIVGKGDDTRRELCRVARAALDSGISMAFPGNRVGDISHAIQKTAELAGFNVSREFVGHAIGKVLHMEPWVPNYGRVDTGRKLVAGMCLAIEPIIFDGSWRTVSLGTWGISSKKGILSAQEEDTIFITENGPINITR